MVAKCDEFGVGNEYSCAKHCWRRQLLEFGEFGDFDNVDDVDDVD